jgi:WD40 repeat protein
MSKKDNYELIHFLDIRFADPISSLKLINNYVITGTMMGRVNLYNISNNKTASLSELNSENISDISYNEKEKIFYVGIGDEEIRYFFIDQLNLDPIPQNQPINVYDSDITHTNNCENAFILLSPESLFRIQLPQIDDGTLKIITIESQYEIKYFNEEKEINKIIIKLTLPTINYAIPFNFDR